VLFAVHIDRRSGGLRAERQPSRTRAKTGKTVGRAMFAVADP